MQEEHRIRYLDSLRQSAKAGTGPTGDCYRDPAAFDVELAHVLRPGWHAVARWDSLPEAGDYASIDLCGEPLLLVRDDEHRLRVLSRVCRHRGHTVVEGNGNAKRLVCPYHRWAYGLDGQLKTAPLMKQAPGFDRARCGLPELPTELWQGFLLTSLDCNAKPIGCSLTPLTERIAPLGLEQMVDAGCLEFDSPWNWKVMVDNFMESYHHVGPHAQSLHKTNPAQLTAPVDLDGPFSLLDNPGADGAPGFLAAQVFPTLIFFVQDGMPVGGWYEMQIDRHDHLNLRIHLLTTPELAATEEIAKELIDFVRQIHLEDIPACEAVQRGLGSLLWQPGPLSLQEGCLVRFHDYLAERLGCVMYP